MTVILDTSFLFALTDRRDRNHSAVLEVVGTLRSEPVLPDVVLPEICYLIASRLGHRAMRQFVASLDPGQVKYARSSRFLNNSPATLRLL